MNVGSAGEEVFAIPCNSHGEHGQMPEVCEATIISKFELLNQNEATGC